jgi:hypothetical protein
MKPSYNLLSVNEPNEKELNSLMKNVLKEVNIRFKIGKIQFDKLQNQQIKEVFEKYKAYNFQK